NANSCTNVFCRHVRASSTGARGREGGLAAFEGARTGAASRTHRTHAGSSEAYQRRSEATRNLGARAVLRQLVLPAPRRTRLDAEPVLSPRTTSGHSHPGGFSLLSHHRS